LSRSAASPRRCLGGGLASAFGAAALGWVLAGAFAMPAESNTACSARKFHTDLVKQACARGGQAAAKQAMKRFMADAEGPMRKLRLKGARELSCDSCHTRLAPDYPLTKDGLALFRRLGGR
jgi:hypothetical protein